MRLLESTGIAGRPNESLHGPSEPFHRKKAGIEGNDYADYLAWVIKEGTTSNGIFGVKLSGNESGLRNFVKKISPLPFVDSDASVPEQLESVFPGLKYIWVTRRNRIRQAVSEMKAVQTGFWSSFHYETRKQWAAANKGEPQFDLELLEEKLLRFLLEDAFWAEFFSEHGIQPYVLVYEDFIQDLEGTLRALLRFLEIPIPQDLTIDWDFLPKRQADDISEAFVQKYRELKQADWRTKSW